MTPDDQYIDKLITDPELKFKIIDYTEGIKFEQQCDAAYAVSELIFMLAGKDCAKARSFYDQWSNSQKAQNPNLEYFVGELHSALDAIEHREGQPRPLMSWCDLSDKLEKANESNE